MQSYLRILKIITKHTRLVCFTLECVYFTCVLCSQGSSLSKDSCSFSFFLCLCDRLASVCYHSNPLEDNNKTTLDFYVVYLTCVLYMALSPSLYNVADSASIFVSGV